MSRSYFDRHFRAILLLIGVVGTGVMAFASSVVSFGTIPWVFAALTIVGVFLPNVYCAIRGGRIAPEVVATTNEPPAPSAPMDASTRLRRPEDLQKQGLLTAAK